MCVGVCACAVYGRFTVGVPGCVCVSELLLQPTRAAATFAVFVFAFAHVHAGYPLSPATPPAAGTCKLFAFCLYSLHIRAQIVLSLCVKLTSHPWEGGAPRKRYVGGSPIHWELEL